MRKISEYQDEEALDLLADLIEPVGKIVSNSEMLETIRNKDKLKAVKLAIKNNKEELMIILARLEGVPREKYHCNPLSLPIAVLFVLTDESLLDFFKSQGQNLADVVSGTAMESGTGEASGDSSSIPFQK